MKASLLVIATILFGVALRSTKQKCARKIGVLFYIVATGLTAYFVSHSILIGMLVAGLWILFPWVVLICSVRKTRLPLENKLCKQSLPCGTYFPEAAQIKQKFLEKGYEHVTDCGWQWAKSHEHYSFFWNEEEKHLIAICHRIQSCVTFCYLNITSTAKDGTIWRSSNFPFSSSLPLCPTTKLNHVTDGNIACPEHMLYSHELFLYNKGIDNAQLEVKNVAQISQCFEQEMRSQIDHNLQSGMIQLTGDGHFRYTYKGLIFLWRQTLKDMFRMC